MVGDTSTNLAEAKMVARASPFSRVLGMFGEGNGPIDAFVLAINKHFDLAIRILDYEEHAVGNGAVMGVGMHRNILTDSLNAIISALNRAIRDHRVLLHKIPVKESA